MTNIKQIYTCPKCEEGITAVEKPKVCPGCGYKFPLMGEAGFMDPTTLAEQKERIRDDDAYNRFLVDLPITVANNIMQDALHIISTIPGKNVKVNDIRQLVQMALQIGEVAKKYNAFLEAGGKHVPSLFIQDDGESDEQQATTNERSTTAPVPTPLFPSMEQNNGSGDDIFPR